MKPDAPKMFPKPKYAITLLASAVVLASIPSPSAAQDAASGEELAEMWCNACHSVGINEPRMFDAGPPFSALAEKETEYLLNAIVRPHDFMPEFPRLGYSDMLDLAAYIQTVE